MGIFFLFYQKEDAFTFVPSACQILCLCLDIPQNHNCYQKQLILVPYPLVVILLLSIWFSDENELHGGLYCWQWCACLTFIHGILLPSCERLVILQVTNTHYYSTLRKFSNDTSYHNNNCCSENRVMRSSMRNTIDVRFTAQRGRRRKRAVNFYAVDTACWISSVFSLLYFFSTKSCLSSRIKSTSLLQALEEVMRNDVENEWFFWHHWWTWLRRGWLFFWVSCVFCLLTRPG